MTKFDLAKVLNIADKHFSLCEQDDSIKEMKDMRAVYSGLRMLCSILASELMKIKE